MELLNMFLNEHKPEYGNKEIFREYSEKRDKINCLAEQAGFKERRDGRGTVYKEKEKNKEKNKDKKIIYRDINDRIEYCNKYLKNGKKDELKKTLENFNELRNNILRNYLRLVINSARKYSLRRDDLDDLDLPNRGMF